MKLEISVVKHEISGEQVLPVCLCISLLLLSTCITVQSASIPDDLCIDTSLAWPTHYILHFSLQTLQQPPSTQLIEPAH